MRSAALFTLIALLLLVACSDHRQRLLQLEELERQNRADSVLLNDSLARALCEWFDDHGTANERLRAHYILGRTYADLGEAPAAIAAYMDAADCADTTATDCDYHTLSRVYGQMSDVFYQQGLIQEFFEANKLAIAFAWKGKDTLQALNEEMYAVAAYDNRKQFDMVIPLFDHLFHQFSTYYGIEVASRYCILPIRALLELGHIEKARFYLETYEKESGYFNSPHEIECGREVYFYYRGLYYLYTHHLDSAEFFYRKELQLGSDYINQDMGARGLSLVFAQANMPDSAAKYALYSYEMNDSVYTSMAALETQRMAALYNYNRLQHIAIQEQEKMKIERAKGNRTLLAFIISISLLLLGAYLWHKKKKEVSKRYKEITDALEAAEKYLLNLHVQQSAMEELIKEKETTIKQQESELIVLHSEKSKYARLIEEKEEVIIKKNNELSYLRVSQEMLLAQVTKATDEVEMLQKEVEQYEKCSQLTLKSGENDLVDSDDYQALMERCKSGRKLNDEEWTVVDRLIKDSLPGFHNFISAKRMTFSVLEYRLCQLLRLHIGQKEISHLIGVTQSDVSKMSKKILSEVFDEKGSGKELRRILDKMN